MGVVTWDGSASTDYGTAANWDSGVVPSASSNVVIPDTSSINNCVLDTNRTVNSFRINANGTFDGDGNTLTIDNEGDATTGASEGYAVNIDGIIAGTDTDIQITTPATTQIDLAATSGSIRHLTINHASCVAQMYSDVSLSGNLTITAGQLTTGVGGYGYSNLTVAGITTIGDGTGGTPDEATLTCNASTCSFGSGVTSDYGILVKANGTFAGGTGTHTAGGFYMDQNAAAKATMTTGVMTINSEKTSANKAWRVEYGGDTFDNANGTVKFHLNGFDTRMSMRGASHANNAFHNLIIDADTSARQLSPDNGTKIIVDNDLTITNGKLVMGMSHALEVGGDVEIDDASGTAILEMGSSSNISSQAATFGSLTIGDSGTYKATSGTTTVTSETSGGYTWRNNGGTFTHNDGTVTTNSSVDTKLRENTFYNLIINQSSSGKFVYWEDTSGNTCTVANDLTITTGRLRGLVASDTVTVTGDVTVSADGTFNHTSVWTGSINHGSLTIESGGTYAATSGTTTITSETSGGFAMVDQGTFTHNNGTVQIGDGSTSVGSGTHTKVNTFYNLTVNMSGTTIMMLMRPNSGSTMTVLNNVTVQNGVLTKNSHTNTFDFGGLVTVGIGGGSLAAHIDSTTSGTATDNFGALTILTDGKYTQPTTTNVSSIRNVGGTIA